MRFVQSQLFYWITEQKTNDSGIEVNWLVWWWWERVQFFFVMVVVVFKLSQLVKARRIYVFYPFFFYYFYFSRQVFFSCKDKFNREKRTAPGKIVNVKMRYKIVKIMLYFKHVCLNERKLEWENNKK